MLTFDLVRIVIRIERTSVFAGVAIADKRHPIRDLFDLVLGAGIVKGRIAFDFEGDLSAHGADLANDPIAHMRITERHKVNDFAYATLAEKARD